MNTGNYVLQLTAISILCAVSLSLLSDGSGKTLLRLVGSVILVLTLMQPLLNIQLPKNDRWFSEYQSEGENLAAIGEELAVAARGEFIKQRLCAYILDKAAALGADISVDIVLNQQEIPKAIVLSGNVSQIVRQQLSQIIVQDLGISKENQKWTG